jgi:OmpA family
MSWLDRSRAAVRHAAGTLLVAALFATACMLAASPSARAGERGRDHFAHGWGYHGGYHGYGRYVRAPGGYYHGYYGRPFYRYGYGYGYAYGPCCYVRYGYPYPFPYPYDYGYGHPYIYPGAPIYAAMPPVYPPPPPRYAAPRPRRFEVYFDFNRADLTPAGRQVVDAAVVAARAGGPSEIEITGNTDLAGTGAYNWELSKRRAQMVRRYMVSRGIDPSEIATRWLGKTRPAVATPNGVRAARNRRVEIVVSPDAPGPTSMRGDAGDYGETDQRADYSSRPVGPPTRLLPAED